MQALVKYARGKGNTALREVPRPVPGPGEVLIEVSYTGICGSDLKILEDEHPYYPPVILGHEFSGSIVEVGPEVSGWAPGDRVVSELHTGRCGSCPRCRSGEWHVCPAKRAPGWGIDGAFAKHVKMPAWLLHRIPDGVSLKEAALAEPLAVAVHAVLERTGVEPCDTVVVLGCGPLGLLAAQLARARGAAQVVITGTERDEAVRLAKARELGFAHVVNVSRSDPAELVLDLTGGEGADLVIDFAGSPAALSQGFALVRTHGRFCAVGVPPTDTVEVPWKSLVFKGVQVVFNFSSRYSSWERALGLMAARAVRAETLVTHVLPLAAWEEGFQAARGGEAIKVLLTP